MRFSIFPPSRHSHLCGGMGATLTGNSPRLRTFSPGGRVVRSWPYRSGLSMQLFSSVSVGALSPTAFFQILHRQDSNLRQNGMQLHWGLESRRQGF